MSCILVGGGKSPAPFRNLALSPDWPAFVEAVAECGSFRALRDHLAYRLQHAAGWMDGPEHGAVSDLLRQAAGLDEDTVWAALIAAGAAEWAYAPPCEASAGLETAIGEMARAAEDLDGAAFAAALDGVWLAHWRGLLELMRGLVPRGVANGVLHGFPLRVSAPALRC